MTDEPWEQNLCFTIKADSQEEVERMADKINATARRVGAGEGFCDYSGPQPEDGPNREETR